MRGRIPANITFFLAVMSLLGCNPPASQTGPSSTTAVNEQSYEEMMVVRDRINVLADPDMEGKFQKDDIEFLKKTAIEGELVNSSMAFTLLRIAIHDKVADQEDVVACYIQRLKKVSGMKAVIAMRNLENLIAQRLAANIEKRDDLIAPCPSER